MASKKLRRPQTHQENELQTAIVSSLQVWSYKKDVRCTSMTLYANQQGAGLGRLCADFITTFNDSEILLAEVKVHVDGILQSFSKKQYDDDLELEERGLPILYLYNLPRELAYHQKPQPRNYPDLTLSAINYSVPSLLPNVRPHIDKHGNLLDLLETYQVDEGDKISRFAELFGIIRSEALLTNGLLMLAYGTEKIDLFEDVNSDTLTDVINALSHGAAGNYLTPRAQDLLQEFLKEEAQAFARWDYFKKNRPAPSYTPPGNNGGSTGPRP